tara:strand:+ start:886 stop:1527 length:642 start_codon:yes stop_codon:yes gene_type:complete
MAVNPYFYNYGNEQNLVEDMTIEIIKATGQDCLYVPRQYLNIDKIFGENPASSFTKTYTIEMYLQSYKGFEGTDIISQFGIEIKDKVTLVFARKRFNEEVTINDTAITRPREGDLIYFPLSKSLFEINFVEHENPFYPLGKLYSYYITAELFTYSYEKINTNITAIDSVSTVTKGLSGGVIIPRNNILGTTAGINDVIDDEAVLFNVDKNEPC